MTTKKLFKSTIYSLVIILFLCYSPGTVFCDSNTSPMEDYFWDHPEKIEVLDSEMAFTSEIFDNVKNQNIFFMTRFNDGWVFMTSYFGFRTRTGFIKRWGIYVVVTNPQGREYFYTLEMNDRNMQFDEDRLFITDGRNTIYGSGNQYHVRYDFEGFSCNLTFRNILPPWKPGDGREVFTEEKDVFERRIVNCPWADVTGEMTFDGIHKRVKGEGYSEFSIIVVPFRRMNPSMHALRVFSPQGTPQEKRWHLGILDYLNHEYYGSERFPRLILGKGNDYVITTKDYVIEELDWTVAGDTPWKYPRRLKISYNKNGYILEGVYISQKLFDITDIFAEIPAIIRNFLLAFMDRPVYIRNLGEFTGYIMSPDGGVESLHLFGPYEYLLAQ